MTGSRRRVRDTKTAAGPLGWTVHLALWAGALAVALGIGLWRPGETDSVFGRLEGLLADARFVLRGPLPAPSGVAILAIDDAEIAAHEEFPPPRSALADAIEAATEAGAAAVALDLLLVGSTEYDPRLAAALQRSQRAVVAAAVLPDSLDPGTPRAVTRAQYVMLERSQYPVVLARGAVQTVVAPDEMLLPDVDFAPDATLGTVSVSVERDGDLRRLPASMAVGPVPEGSQGATIYLPGLAPAALARALDADMLLRLPDQGVGGRLEIGAISVPLDAHGDLPLVHYGPSGTIPTWPLRDAASADLAGRVVFVGATALGFGDLHGNPFDPALSGVEAHAALAANLLEGRSLRRDGVAWLGDIGACLAIAALAFAAASRDRPGRVVLASAGVMVLAAVALQAGFVLGWWFDAVSWIGAFAAGAGGGSLLRVLRDRRRVENLSLYQSPELAEMLAREGRPSFDGRTMVCGTVFADLADFTGYSERAGPDAAGRLMGAFQDSVVASAKATGGVVTQFSGDGAMVVFGLLDEKGMPAEGALRFVDALADKGRSWPGSGLRVGAHLGPVVAGVMGSSSSHRQVTVAGDAVNVANRLQGEAKARGAVLALSDALLSATQEPETWITELGLASEGQCMLRGRTAALEIWIAKSFPL